MPYEMHNRGEEGMIGYALRLKPTGDLFGWRFHNFSAYPEQAPILFDTVKAAKCCLTAHETRISNPSGGFAYSGKILIGNTKYLRTDFEVVEFEVLLTELSTQTCERKK